MFLSKILAASSFLFSKGESWREWLVSKLDLVDALPELHNEHVKIEEETLQWSVDFKLIKEGTKGYLKSQAAQFSKLCSYALKDAPKEHVKVVSELVAWLFERDDKLDQKEEDLGDKPDQVRMLDERNLQILRGTLEPESASEKALKDLRDKAYKANPDLVTLVAKFRDYFQANWLEAERRDQHKKGIDISKLASVSSYYEFRIFTSAVQVYYELASIVLKDPLTDEDKENVVIQKLSNTSAYIIGVHNDLFSLGKELEEDYAENLVLIEMRENNLTLKEALNKVIANVNKLISEYKALRDDFLRKPMNSKFREYIERMDKLIDGNVIFSSKSERYKIIPKELLL